MIKREIEKKIEKVNEQRKVLLLTGARQVGKSTLVNSIKEKERTYITLDDLNLRELAQNDPKLFLMNYERPIIIDEVQYAPNLFSYIKMEADKTKDKGSIWLAGRISIVELSSLSYAEKKCFKSKLFLPNNISSKFNITPKEIFEEIFLGGMPEYVCDKIDRNIFFNDYVTTYLERDVRGLTQVGNLMTFRKFLVAVAARNGEVWNYNSICEDVGIDATTAKRWISILEASDIIYLLQPYFNSALKRATKSPKIIFLDSGLCSYLCGWNSGENIMNSTVSGHYLESFVISELIKNKRNSEEVLNYDIYYYRDKDGKEIDLIISLDNVIYPFEIKKTANPNVSMISNFKILENKNIKVGNGGLLCFYPEIIPLDEHNKSYPISVIF